MATAKKEKVASVKADERYVKSINGTKKLLKELRRRSTYKKKVMAKEVCVFQMFCYLAWCSNPPLIFINEVPPHWRCLKKMS